MTDDVIARRRAALLAVGLDPNDMAPGVVEDRAPPAPQSQSPPLTPSASNDLARHGLPVEVVKPLSDQAWSIIGPHLQDRSNTKHTMRLIADGMMCFVIAGTPWSDLGTVRGGFYSACRNARGRDCWRQARNAASLGIADETERRHFMRVAAYMSGGDWRLLAERHGLARYVARATGRTKAVREAAQRADDTAPPRRSRLDVPFRAR